MLRFQDAKRLGEDAIALYRKKHGLLSADQIRAIREHFNLTQADLARLLRLGVNTVSRWESGRNVQTAALDILLRLIRDLPSSIEYLREHGREEVAARPEVLAYEVAPAFAVRPGDVVALLPLMKPTTWAIE